MYKLAVDDLVGVTIKGTNRRKDGVEREFKFVLVCDRLPQDAMKDAQSDPKSIQTFFEEHAKGWQRQDLVVDEDGKPAEFSLDALRVLMAMYGMPILLWHSYAQQAAANLKN